MADGVVTLTIDGKDVSAQAGQTILEVALENGIRIPRLCYMKGLSIWAGCRLCLVEVEGSTKLLAACSPRSPKGRIFEPPARGWSPTGG